jgi:hypothetical protein
MKEGRKETTAVLTLGRKKGNKEGRVDGEKKEKQKEV